MKMLNRSQGCLPGITDVNSSWRFFTLVLGLVTAFFFQFLKCIGLNMSWRTCLRKLVLNISLDLCSTIFTS